MTGLDYDHLIESLTEEIYRRLGPAQGPSHECACSGPQIEELVHCGACRVSVHPPSPSLDPATAQLIDHTLLKPDATRADIVKICEEAAKFSFASVCVNPYWIPLVAGQRRASTARVCTRW